MATETSTITPAGSTTRKSLYSLAILALWVVTVAAAHAHAAGLACQ